MEVAYQVPRLFEQPLHFGEMRLVRDKHGVPGGDDDEVLHADEGYGGGPGDADVAAGVDGPALAFAHISVGVVRVVLVERAIAQHGFVRDDNTSQIRRDVVGYRDVWRVTVLVCLPASTSIIVLKTS